jgi:hypothetical protein
VIAVEVKEPKGFGRVRMRHIPDASGNSLVPFVCDVVAPGAELHTDGWGGYNDLPKHGYTRQKTVLSFCLFFGGGGSFDFFTFFRSILARTSLK